ncbi:RNA polymerase sigma factor [Nocardioides sp. LHG3406-4]|uniref:RNA polymerase sigma factor n=1 Tax=Nocardioides sp. LHG3406-4 TaxID=2804575 RepID=UPI003CEB3159
MTREERFEALAREVIDPVRRFLARRTDADTAEDVLSETLLVLWRRFDDVPDNALPWAYGVARGCLQNAERSRRRQDRVAAKLAGQPVEPHPTGTDPRLADALGRLPERDRELLRLWAWEQLSPAEIGAVLDMTPNAASIRLHRAKGKLLDELRKAGSAAGHEGAEGRPS